VVTTDKIKFRDGNFKEEFFAKLLHTMLGDLSKVEGLNVKGPTVQTAPAVLAMMLRLWTFDSWNAVQALS
jgi:hypothetical protein